MCDKEDKSGVSILIPAYNEEAGVGQTVERVRRTLDESGAPYEVLVIDDGSTDETARRAEAAGAKVIRHLQNLGYGKALKTGVAAARYDTLAMTDADGTYPVERLPEMIDLHRRGYHMVVGERTGPLYAESVVKSPLRRALKLLVEFTAARPVPDINSGLRVFARRDVRKFLDRLCDTFSFTTSMTLAYLMNGMFVAYLPISYGERIGRTKVRLLRDSLRTLQYVSQAALYYDPLKIFSALAGFCVVLSIGGFVATLIFSLKSTYFLGIGGLLVALIVFALGLVADLLKQILHK